MSFEGRVALVTGANGGIGRAVVTRLLAEGATVVGSYRSSRPSRTDFTGGDSRTVDAAGRLDLVEADMADTEALPGLIAAAEKRHGRIDFLLPVAGIGQVRSFDEVTLADWRSAIEVNLTAPFVLAQAVAPGMRSRGFGRLLFVSSVAAYTGGFVGPHYAASKAGLHGLVHFLAGRLAASGITANAIAPALIDGTGMIAGMPSGSPHPPVGRLGQPAEVADLAMSILENGYLNGQVVLLDGGMRPS